MNPPSRTLLILGLLSSSALAVPGYLPHQTNLDIFRLDLISLTQSQMKSASTHLLTLAKRPDSTGPEDLRATAQLIALAERLSPGNKTPQQLTETLKDNNKKLPQASAEEVSKSTQLLLTYTEWLIDKNASEESQRLGKLILDPLSHILPNEALTKGHDASGQESRWSNLVSSVTAYQKVAKLENIDVNALMDKPLPTETTTETTTEAPLEAPHEVADNEAMEESSDKEDTINSSEIVFHHKKLSLKTPLSVKSSSRTRVIRLVDLDLNIDEQDQEDDYYRIGSNHSNALFKSDKVDALVRSSWTHQFKTEPKGKNIIFKTSKAPSRAHNGTIASAPLAALLHASATEGTFRKNLILVGKLTENGDLTKPKRMWAFLRSLKSAKRSRILVPQDALTEFTAFLVLNTPEFFLSNEVYGVRNLQDVLDLSIKERQPAQLTEALALHAEICAVAKGKDIRDLATNIHVRERLKKIKSLAPNFANASLLLLQGSGDRPTTYSRDQLVVEAEIFHLFLRPVAIKYGTYDLSHKDLKTKEDLFAEKLEAFKKLTAFGERDILDKIENLYARLRTLTRECRSDDYDDRMRQEKAFKSFQEVYKGLAKDFAEIHDETPDRHFFNQNQDHKEEDKRSNDADPF